MEKKWLGLEEDDQTSVGDKIIDEVDVVSAFRFCSFPKATFTRMRKNIFPEKYFFFVERLHLSGRIFICYQLRNLTPVVKRAGNIPHSDSLRGNRQTH